VSAVRASELSADALLQRYRDRGYTDCWSIEIARRVTHAAYVEAFYTTPVFRLERWILRLVVGRPSTDTEAHRLAHGEADRFAAWTVEARAPDQLLMCDHTQRTRSWLMVSPATTPGHTTLWFGSAVVSIEGSRTGEHRLGATYAALLGFHKLYSRILLRVAAARLGRRAS
jgi:hypothetical protein